MSSETFEQVLTGAQAAGSVTPAWKKFVNTRFFVAIVRSPDNDPKHFTLDLQDDGGKSVVTVSELRERVAAQQGSALVALAGAEVVRRLPAGAGILVALGERVFAISPDRVDWLRKGIEAARARAADKARQAAAGFPVLDQASAPAPFHAAPPAAAAAPVVLAKPNAAPAAPAAMSPVQRNQVGVLDVAALKPRNVTLPKIGLEFFVPSSWTESTTTTGLRFTDAERGSTVEASGFHRPNLSLAQWMEMRMTLVRHEMRYLTQDGESYPFEGERWRSRVKGMATEFTGFFPGEQFESRYLVACIWTDGVLASIAVRAPADAFEQHRSLYKWLLGRVDMNEQAATIYSPPGSSLAAESDFDDVAAPPMFGFSLAGRMGRMRVLAYSFPVMLSLAVVGILAAVLVPANQALGVALLALGLPAGLWFCIRLMVLRMHDVGISGKWLAGVIGLMLLAGVLRNPKMLFVVGAIFWLGSLVIYCFIPGTDGDNDYGEAPGPNSTLVNVGAALFILAQLAQLGAAGSGRYNDRLPFPAARSSGGELKAGTVFSPPGNGFSVMLPGVPQEIAMPQAVIRQMGDVDLRQYQLSAGGNVYMVQSIDYRERMPDNRFDTMDRVQESILGKDGTLVESSPILLKGSTGRQVKVSTTAGGMRAARFAVVGSQIFMVTIDVPNAEKGAGAIDAFLSSFKLN